MGSVATINGGVVVSTKGVNEECINALEEALAMARAGEITGAVVVYSYADGSVGRCSGGYLHQVNVVGMLFRTATKMSVEDE